MFMVLLLCLHLLLFPSMTCCPIYFYLNYQCFTGCRRLVPSVGAAALLLGMSSGNGASKSDLERFCNPFSHPKQPRSARARLLYMPVDSDSN